MRGLPVSRVCQFVWLLLGLTLMVDARMLPSGGANVVEACKYTWQLPGTDCWSPIGQSPRCDHLHSEGCAGSPPTVAHVNQDKAAAGVDHGAELEDPECKPVPGRLPPIRCQDPTVKAARGAPIQTAKVIEACNCTWQLPGTDCWPPIGQSPHCDHLHSEGCAGSPPTVAHVNHEKTTTAGADHVTELEDPDCKPVPGRLPPIRCQDPTVKAAATHHVTELEDPECKPVPGRLPPIRCQDPTVKAAGGASIQTTKVIEACKYTWQLPGTDCWPPIGQGPHCDHLHSEGCSGSPPTVAHAKTAADADRA